MIELNGENYLNGNEACNLLGVKVSTLYAYVSRGRLHSYKQGIKRRRLYKQAELEALLELHPSNDSSFISTIEQTEEQFNNRSDIPRAADWVPNV